MKYVKEIVIIFGITMVGELLNKFIPLPDRCSFPDERHVRPFL